MTDHSFVGDMMTKVPTEVTDAVWARNEILDTKLNALSELTRSLTVTTCFKNEERIKNEVYKTQKKNII
jgi:hypothetical protein